MAEYITKDKLWDTFVDEPFYDNADKDEIVLPIIDSFPAADVAPVVHGRWISWEEAGNYVPSPDRHECSACHDAAQVLVNGLELLSDYCPSCGAKMDGEA